jgi:hypothetical protein
MIPLSEAIDFLSQAAPRPWVTRMLHAMLLNDELQAYFLSGQIRSEIMVSEILNLVEEARLQPHSDARDKAVREALGDEIADRINGKNLTDNILDYESPIEETEGFIKAAVGFIHFGEIDWETGNLICDYIPSGAERPWYLFQGFEEEMGSEFLTNDITAKFSSMHLERGKIEMLLPTHRLHFGNDRAKSALPELKQIGRPRKWDWDAALAFVVSKAQTPDGLPDGPSAQSKIEAMIAEWFESETGDSPSVSQIRTRASTIIRMIEAEKAQKA